MELLGKFISDYDIDGNLMIESIKNWMNDPCWDLDDISQNEYDGSVLRAFQALVKKTGATNMIQIEYFYRLEMRLEFLDRITHTQAPSK